MAFDKSIYKDIVNLPAEQTFAELALAAQRRFSLQPLQPILPDLASFRLPDPEPLHLHPSNQRLEEIISEFNCQNYDYAPQYVYSGMDRLIDDLNLTSAL
ncbi:hypothetical protein HNQ08_005512 [Deinococcus humi]|uniref:Uncharacterized protein n=1 Tax=Deinococcus humi TaxID=662880 RepID=A0A7W8K0S4_9DEIO|nr:hypothetical protein [Deinococcus humi]GGO41522.1 hypothetical protein GCM10008949_52490 [Deinococcus humi]